MLDEFKPGVSFALCFRVSEAMIDKFAVLIGDHSPLHVDPSFARRSMYRTRVAHGMLPIAFLAKVGECHLDNWYCRVVALKARFVAPVFPGDALLLELRTRAAADSRGEVRFDFKIARMNSQQVVTRGEAVMSFQRRPEIVPRDLLPDDQGSILEEKLEPGDFSIDEILPNQHESFGFRLDPGHFEILVSILDEGLSDDPGIKGRSDSFQYENLFGILSLSTFVGMRLPGEAATFVEFDARLSSDLSIGRSFTLSGTVSHVSKAANIVKADISIYLDESGERTDTLSASVTTMVGRRPVTMPTMPELRNAASLDLDGKVVLVTGASRGIGETIAKLFACFGSSVVVNYFCGKTDAERVVREISEDGGQAIAVQADVRDRRAVEAMIDAARSRFGGLDILVNNAVSDFRPVPFADLTWDDIQGDMDVTVRGALNCSQAAIPEMLARGGGKIVSVSSAAADDPPPGQIKYVVSKSALNGLMRALAVELAPKNIQVNAVVPHMVETDLIAHIQEGFIQKVAGQSPMGRLASPIEVAQAVILASSAFSAYTTGQRWMVTGGRLPFL